MENNKILDAVNNLSDLQKELDQVSRQIIDLENRKRKLEKSINVQRRVLWSKPKYK